MSFDTWLFRNIETSKTIRNHFVRFIEKIIENFLKKCLYMYQKLLITYHHHNPKYVENLVGEYEIYVKTILNTVKQL